MKKILIALFLFSCTFSFSQDKFNSGFGFGVISIDKNNGINENLFFAYNTSKTITVGIDALISKIDFNSNSLKTNSIIAYIEACNPERGIIKNKLYFSGIIGFGYLEQKNDFKYLDSGTAFVGTKFNYKVSDKFLTGIKSGYYINSHENVIISNLFLNFKF